MSAHFERAALLFDQRKYGMAEEELRLALLEDPENASAHALLGLCLVERGRFDDAEAEAGRAIHGAPDDSFGHYALSRILLERNRLDEAAAAAEEAARLEPDDPDYAALLAQARYNQRRWPAALEAAERGLALDPEHVGCTNFHAMALIKLGRKEQAADTLDAALAREPENAFSHSNRGWALLEQGDPRKAAEHFREALRLDPTLEHARAGIVEALKAKNIVYRLMLKWFLWMTKLSSNAQWGVVVGLFIGYQIVQKVARENPALAPYLLPLIIAYIVFALMTWIAAPLFNLALRMSRFGRLVLSRDQVAASNCVGACVLTGLGFLVAGFALGKGSLFNAALFFGLLTLPVAGLFQCEKGWPRKVMTAYVGVLLLLGVTYFALPYGVLGGMTVPALLRLRETIFTVFLVAAFVSQWVAGGLSAVSPRK